MTATVPKQARHGGFSTIARVGKSLCNRLLLNSSSFLHGYAREWQERDSFHHPTTLYPIVIVKQLRTTYQKSFYSGTYLACLLRTSSGSTLAPGCRRCKSRYAFKTSLASKNIMERYSGTLRTYVNTVCKGKPCVGSFTYTDKMGER